jgi:hypothetical protein
VADRGHSEARPQQIGRGKPTCAWALPLAGSVLKLLARPSFDHAALGLKKAKKSEKS